MNVSKTEGTAFSTDPLRIGRADVFRVEETELSPANSKAAMKVASFGDYEEKEAGDAGSANSPSVGQQCFPSWSAENSATLKKIPHFKLDALSGVGLKINVEKDPMAVLNFLGPCTWQFKQNCWCGC